MKAQSYYWCGKCGLIAARDAGERLSGCPDCGNGNLKILIPVDDEAKSDPLSKRKKATLAALIGFAGVGAIAAFLLFGRLLQGYMTFAAGHEAAEKAHQRLSVEIKAQETSLSLLSRRIAESEQKKGTLAEVESRHAMLTKGISLIETERNQIRETLQSAAFELASVTGTVNGLKVEIGAITRERNSLAGNVALEAMKRDKLDTEVQKATETLRQAKAAGMLANIELEETQKTMQLERLALSNETVRVAGVRNKLAELDGELNRTRNQAYALAAEDARLTAVIDSAVSHTNRLAFVTSNAEKAKASAVVELAKIEAELDEINAKRDKARDKAREEADMHSARMASLAVRIEALDAHILEMEKIEAKFAATIPELKKQQVTDIMESAKVQAALDRLKAERDKAREEADTQSARVVALKIELASLQTIKADTEKAKEGAEK